MDAAAEHRAGQSCRTIGCDNVVAVITGDLKMLLTLAGLEALAEGLIVGIGKVSRSVCILAILNR